MIAFGPPATDNPIVADSPPWLQIVITLIGTVGTVAGVALAGGAFRRAGKSVKAADVAATVAAETKDLNTSEHGQNTGRIAALTTVVTDLVTLVADLRGDVAQVRDDVKHVNGRLDDVGRNAGVGRDQLMAHWQWHLEHPPPSPMPPPPNQEPTT